MNKLLIFLISLCVTSLEAATITNWGTQLPTTAPNNGSVILMQQGGITYYFTPDQLTTYMATNLTAGGSFTPASAMASNAIANLNGKGTNTTFYGIVTGATVRATNIYDKSNVKFWGAVGNGSSSDTIAIQAALDSLPSGGGAIYFPAGDYSITNTIHIVSRGHQTLLGSGVGSKIIWNGPVGGDMIAITNCFRTVFQDLALIGHAGAAPTNLIRHHVNTAYPSVYGIGQPVFERVKFGGDGSAMAGWGVYFSATTDQNNDMGIFNDCFFVNLVKGGLAFAHSQSKGHMIRDCYFVSAQCGVSTADTSSAGSFYLTGGFMGAHTVADIWLQAPNDTLYIGGFRSEGSKQLLRQEGLSGAAFAVSLKDITFSTDSVTNSHEVINFRSPGPLSLINCRFAASGDETNFVRVASLAEGALNIVGCIFGSTNADFVILEQGKWTLKRQGNICLDSGGNGQLSQWCNFAVSARGESIVLQGTNSAVSEPSNTTGSWNATNGVLTAYGRSLFPGGLAVGAGNDPTWETYLNGTSMLNGNVSLGGTVQWYGGWFWTLRVIGTTGNRLEFYSAADATTPAYLQTNGTFVATAFSGGSVGIATATPLAPLHVVGGIHQTNGGIWQTWSLGAPSAPASTNAGAVLWNDGTNWCSVFRNHAGVLSTNKLSMTAWP